MVGSGWVVVIGLALDVVGVLFLSVGLIMSRREAIDLGVTRLAGSTDEENLQLPAVQNLLKQSNRTAIGLVLILVGFLLQIVGNWPS